VAAALHGQGARVTVYDPVALDRARRARPELSYAASMVAAAADADVVLLATEWREFTEADPVLLGKAVARRSIVDARNALDPAAWRAAGWSYRALGRP
jgi:UDPglucose 6-dehydrogenase